MANHVSTHISFDMNEAAQEALMELYQRSQARPDDQKDCFSGMITEDWPETRSDAIDLMGAKWCFIEDCEEDYLNLCSAWSYPQDGIIRLLELLVPHDPELKARITYDDEMPNFFGVEEWHGLDLEKEEEFTWEELLAYALKNVPSLDEHWDEEAEDWKSDEGHDLFYDNMYDCINDMQMEALVDDD